jgi:hypothetical protein
VPDLFEALVTSLTQLIKTDLYELKAGHFVSKWFAEKTPFVFGADAEAHTSWRRDLAAGLGISLFSITLIGSAAVGISLNPSNNFAPFDQESDIDVAVVSSFHFDEAWRWLRQLGSERYGLPATAQKWIKEHETRLIYWGMIATDQLLPHMPMGSRWLSILAGLSQFAPVNGRDISVRLYRDFDALEGALQHSVRKMKTYVQGLGEQP